MDDLNNFGMKYNCTLLKDLPQYDAGTKFTIQEFEWCNRLEYYCQFPEDIENDRMSYPNYRIPRSVIDNPVWVKKEPDEECFTELKCRKCGGTKMLLQVPTTKYDYDDGVYYYKRKLIGICKCGHINEFLTFKTHTRVTY